MRYIAILLILMACEPEITDNGCQVGWLKGTTTYVLIRCATNAQYIAGDNIEAGGIPLDAYEPGSIAFTPMTECDFCSKLYP